MIVQIKSGDMTCRVATLGAHLTSIQKADGHEYLWQGDPRYWAGQAPVLFPVIGGLSEGTYTHAGKPYPMKKHGFAREMEFTVAEQTENRVDLMICANDDTRKMYPYEFEFHVIYAVCQNVLTQTFCVRNNGQTSLYFSVGGHPAFACPLDESGTFEDCRLVFAQKEQIDARVKKGGYLTGETYRFLAGETVKPLTHALFAHDAIILKALRSDTIRLEQAGSPRSVTMHFAGFPDFGIWSAAGESPFVCLEPWYGVDPTQGDGPAFEDKEGVRALSPGEVFSAAFTMEIA